jgi:hypothetical protein
MVIVGNKDDRSEKVVDSERIEYWCLERGYRFFRVSAKTGIGVKQMIETTVDDLLSSEQFQVAAAGLSLDGAARNKCHC